MTNIEGQLNINLYPKNKNGDRVKVSSSRPLHAPQLMLGKTPEEALNIIPLLYNICGVAQSRTALLAMQHSMEFPKDPASEIARNMIVLAENAREHLFRLFIDWPKLFNLKIDHANLPKLGTMVKDFKQALFTEGQAFKFDSELQVNRGLLKDLIVELEGNLNKFVFHTSTSNWLNNRGIEDLSRWMHDCDSVAAQAIHIICDQGWNSQGYADSSHLPELEVQEILKRLDAEDAEHFIAQPDWQGSCYETTALTRQMEHPLIDELCREFHNTLITRWVARLIELARIPQQMYALVFQLEQADHSPLTEANALPGQGLAQTEAARGRLIHRVEIKHNTIRKYQILAPTEWNFHPQGLITKSLNNLTSKDPVQMEQLARLMINAIDPCVGYELRIN